MRQEIRTVVHDEDLQIEAYRFEGFVRPFPSHFHTYYVIGYIESGQRTLSCNNQEYAVGPGHILIFNPGDSHACVQADGGTLLLDEINSMNINLQSKLLRVLQEGTFRRVGGSAEIHVNVRLLSNTNVPPYQAIQEGNLRQDLFYRLGVVNITIPPLRTRREDIGLLAKRFIIRCNQKLEKNVKNISKATLDRFQAYHWPGNVRELQHAIEHAMNILPDELSTITPAYLPEHILSGMEGPAPQPVPKTKGTSLHTSIRDAAYQTICQALRESGGNISEAARALNMSRQNLQYRIKRYQIDVNALLREKLK